MKKLVMLGLCSTLLVGSLHLLAPSATFAQTASDDWTPPRKPDGRPDLQGVWANNNATPLQRPTAWANKELLVDEELAEIMAAVEEAGDPGQDALFGDQLILAAIERTEASSYDPTTGNYNQFWIADRTFNTNRTSLVIDPPDGLIPTPTPEASANAKAQIERALEHPADSYTDRPLSERCISFGSPNIFAGYNSYIQIIQDSNYVAIIQEMIHDARVVPIDGGPHLDSSVRQLNGDSRGHWEGDTLVIETTNYSGENGVLIGETIANPSQALTVIERFTRVSPDILNYEITFKDPAVWTKPWTILIPLKYSPEPIFEYACHEGNIGMEGILAGHRADERLDSNVKSVSP